jgi:glycine cleavage system H protein
MKYTETHEWIEVTGLEGIVGVSAYAQNELGEIVYVELPKVGVQIAKGQEAAVLESTKAAADVYAPVTGTVTEVNSGLNENPERIAQAPEGTGPEQGWLFKLRLSDPAQLNDLMDAVAYKKTVS